MKRKESNLSEDKIEKRKVSRFCMPMLGLVFQMLFLRRFDEKYSFLRYITSFFVLFVDEFLYYIYLKT